VARPEGFEPTTPRFVGSGLRPSLRGGPVVQRYPRARSAGEGESEDEGLNTTPNTAAPFHKPTSKDRRPARDKAPLASDEAGFLQRHPYLKNCGVL
jgi:hypothetical protein